MEIPTKYSPIDTEDKWYSYWLENKFFKSTPDGREPYVVVIPPPNVTGVLHMGHMLNNTIRCTSATCAYVGQKCLLGSGH